MSANSSPATSSAVEIQRRRLQRLMLLGITSGFAGSVVMIIAVRLFSISDALGLLILPWIGALLISIRMAYRQGVRDGQGKVEDRP